MSQSKAPKLVFGALLLASSACSEASSLDGTDSSAAEGANDGSYVFDPSRVALLELEVSEADLAILRADGERPMGFEDFTYVPARLTYDGTVFEDVGLRVKGNNSRVSAAGDALPFKIDTNRFLDGQKLDGQTKLNLHNNVGQSAKMNEYLSYGAFRQYGVAAPRTGWAEVVINGATLGVYTTVEQVSSKLLSRHYEDGDAPLYKPEAPGGFLNYQGEAFEDYVGVEYEGEDDTDHSTFLRLVRTINDEEVAAWEEAIDVDSVLAYFAGNVALGNWDTYVAMGHNYYLFEASPERMVMLPWDMNLSQSAATSVCPADISSALGPPGGGVFPGEGEALPPGLPPEGEQLPPDGVQFPPDGEQVPPDGIIIGGGAQSAPLHDKLLTDEEALIRYFAHVEKFLSGPASQQTLHARIDEARVALGEHISDESATAMRDVVTQRVSALTEALKNTTNCEPVTAP